MAHRTLKKQECIKILSYSLWILFPLKGYKNGVPKTYLGSTSNCTVFPACISLFPDGFFKVTHQRSVNGLINDQS